VVSLLQISQLRFCGSDLWTRQALAPGHFPAALQERDFIVPGEQLLSHDGRRNLTDLQETAQWLGGIPVAKSILMALLGNLEIFSISFHVGQGQKKISLS